MYIDDRKFSAAVDKLRSVLVKTLAEMDDTTQSILNSKEEVISRYQPIFSPDHIPYITEEEFKSFLLFKNNRHWGGLHRLGSYITQDMDLLRKALNILVDESLSIKTRLDQLLPNSGAMVPRLGRATITPILMITSPDNYGVMNNALEASFRTLGIWPNFERGATFGDRYIAINEILLKLASKLNVDMWTLDYLWWRVSSTIDEAMDQHDGEQLTDVLEGAYVQRFGLERYLHEFLRDNWETILEFDEWSLYEEDGDIVGYEYNTGEVGRIDLLANHKTEPRWLIIELKRDQGTDETLGQVQRYMGWVRENLADKNDHVGGLIISHSIETGLRYALKPTQDIDLLTYEVDFHLSKPENL